ncbi:MAG TPA: MFS transporter [Burkholderiales bacterium]|nr:MFS transporter [Burkholderiales bacterium]
MRSDPAYGWVVVGAAFTLMFVGFSAAYSFAAFFGAFEAEFGASRGDIALVFSLAAFVWFLSGAPAGVLADRYGVRRVALAGVACTAAALWVAAEARSLGVLYATYSIGLGLGVGLTYVPSIGAVQPWFKANRALASGLAVAGIGAGNIAGPLIAAWWIGAFGWRGAYLAFALFAVVLGGLAAAVIKEAEHRRLGSREGIPLAAAVKTLPFWLLFASLLLSCIGLFVPMVHLGPYAVDAGHGAARGVTLVSLIGLGSLVGRFAIGGPADRLGRIPSLAAMYAGLGAMFVLWWTASAYWALALFAVVFGACYGAYVALLPTIVMDLYGPRSVTGIIGCLYTGCGIGTLFGPWLAGVAYDAWGSYQAPIAAGALFSFAAAACVAPLVHGKKRQTLYSS